jgi:hypothetical protein
MFQSREKPNLPATSVFTQSEIKAMQIYLKTPLNLSIGLKEAYINIAKLGGYLNRKNDLPPGILTMTRAMQKLKNITIMLENILCQ